jgi:chemotaxis protein MotB
MAAISRSRRGGDRSINAWPGWVDALSSLIMVVMFVLMVFIVAQFYLSNTLSNRDQALSRLNQQLTELGDLLSMERQANADLRINVGQLSAELQSSVAIRESLAASLSAAEARRDELAGQTALLSRRADQSAEQLTRVGRELEDAYKVIEADRQKIETSLGELASLQADIQALRDVREQLEGQVAALTTVVRNTEAERDQSAAARDRLDQDLRLSQEQRDALLAELGTIRDRAQQLEARVASEEERTTLAQKEIQQRDIRIEDLMAALDSTQAALTGEKKLTEEGRAQVVLLNQQMAALRDQLNQLTAALGAAESKGQQQEVQIADLGRRLNLALASKVEELARYRSEFFGRLREVLGTRQDVRIVGDRFVFQSEVLFPSASATLEEAGKDQLARLASTLLDIARKIPPEVTWILRVDGHTDLRPIATAQFPSNWELSTARAISVVKFLVDHGVPSDRLVAAGFGEYQPLDPGRSEDAFGRNRRIEIKLDQR